MTLIKELQINITMSNYNQRSSSYSSNYDYLFLDNLENSSFSNLFRSDLKNLKIKTLDGTACPVMYIPAYGSQRAAILVRIPVGKISQTTKLILEVHDTTFASTLTPGNDLLMFDANSDTYSQYFMNYSGLSINNDSTDDGKFLRARFVPSFDTGLPSSLFTTFALGSDLTNNRVIAVRFKHVRGNVAVNDNGTFLGSTIGSYMMQSDFNLLYSEDIKETMFYWTSTVKQYCMFEGAKTLVMASSFDAYSSGSDDEGDWRQYHIHGCGYPTGLEHEEKMDVIACLLDEGERNYVNEEHTAWISANQCRVGEMVTLDESSTMEHTIVRKAKEGELAFGYLLGKVQVKTSGLTLVTVAVLGDVFRLKLKRPSTAPNCELPDVAIVNNVRFVWEDNKLYMEWDGCSEDEKVYFI